MAEPATGGGTLPRFAVILGSPRSGTTWLQRVLAAHPNVATPQETHLFALYLAPLFARWERQKRVSERNLKTIESGQADAGRLLGLATILDDVDVDIAARSLLESVIRRTVEAVADERDDIRVVVEKTPSNAEHTDLIERISPATRYIHVIRDPREVAASLIAASSDWGGRWAPRTADSAARMWVEHLEGARQVSAHTDRYIEVRYEDMRKDLPGQLTRILEFLDLPSDGVVELAKQQGEFAYKPAMRKRLGAETKEPAAFSGEGKVRHGLSSSQQLIVEHRTAALRAELGYGVTERWPARSSVQQAAVVPFAGVVSASRQVVRRGLLRAVGNRSVGGMVPED
jgi:hypothetical protein